MKKRRFQISSLGHDVLDLIFGFLTTPEDLWTVSLVCREWHIVSSKNSIEPFDKEKRG